MANLKERAGRISVRVGGNTQETATLVDRLPDNAIIAKGIDTVSNPVRAIFVPSVALI
jgi:hypothetical protein